MHIHPEIGHLTQNWIFTPKFNIKICLLYPRHSIYNILNWSAGKTDLVVLSEAWMVFCNQNCSDLPVRKNSSSDWEKLLKFEAEGWEFANCLRSLEQFIQTVKGQNNFWWHNAFLTCSWRFLRYNELKQSEIGKKYLDLETCRKS